MRSGRYVKQVEGYSAFIPAPLPPDPPIKMDDPELIRLLSDAHHALGRLDGSTFILPNPDLFVAMYVRQEAVLSSQIEGTQSTLEDRRNPSQISRTSSSSRSFVVSLGFAARIRTLVVRILLLMQWLTTCVIYRQYNFCGQIK